MPNYFTIAMAEMWPGSFKVVCYGISEKCFLSIHMEHQDIISSNNEIKWDIFALTEARLIATNREYYVLRQEGNLRKYYSKDEARTFFDNRCIDAAIFFKSDETYAVIAPDTVTIHPPEVDGSSIKHKVGFKCDNYSRSKVLNKDYRMLKYWANVDKAKFKEKANYWQGYVQAPDKQVYLVMYNHTFRNGRNKKWIAGFHCL